MPEADGDAVAATPAAHPMTQTERRATERDTMTPSIQDVDHPPTTRRVRRVAALASVAVAVVLAACSSGSSTGSTTTAASASTTAVLVKPPDLTLQGCNYVINGSVPAGASGGIQPPFTLSGPNAAGQAALAHIKAHGGTGLVNGYLLPPGVKLYAGPDAGSTPVATIADARSLFVADPVLWTSRFRRPVAGVVRRLRRDGPVLDRRGPDPRRQQERGSRRSPPRSPR